MLEPGNLVPSRFSGQIRKVEARLRKFIQKIRKVGGETLKEKKKGPRLILVRKLGKLDQIRKVGMGY